MWKLAPVQLRENSFQFKSNSQQQHAIEREEEEEGKKSIDKNEFILKSPKIENSTFHRHQVNYIQDVSIRY